MVENLKGEHGKINKLAGERSLATVSHECKLFVVVLSVSTGCVGIFGGGMKGRNCKGCRQQCIVLYWGVVAMRLHIF